MIGERAHNRSSLGLLQRDGGASAPGRDGSPDDARPGDRPSTSGAGQSPHVSLPKGGGAIRGIGEKFAVNPATGTGSLSVPLPLSPGRSGFTPSLSLSYDSGAGNGPFGLGWSVSLPSITRKTDKGLPRYCDGDESDVFILSGAEDLVPILNAQGRRVTATRAVHGTAYEVWSYRPRIEGLFARIERWVEVSTGLSHWRTVSRDNVTSLYGLDALEPPYASGRVADPDDPRKIFSYLLCRTWDDKGNLEVYDYLPEDGRGVDRSASHEANRTDTSRAAQRYLKSVRYGSVQPYFPAWGTPGPEAPLPTDWLFQVVFDYGDHTAAKPTPQPDQAWAIRPDPFSTYRPSFEVRTYRRVARVLVFHNFPAEPNVGADCLVRSLDLTYSDQESPADPRNPMYTFLAVATQSGYRREGAGYLRRSMPPLEFTYSQPTVQPDVLTLDPDSQTNLPEGIDGARFQWVDLDGEGLPGILTDSSGSWGYKRNLSPINRVTLSDGTVVTRARFGPFESVPTLPSRSELGGSRQLLDLAGGGTLDVVDFAGPAPGFFKRTFDGDWEPFKTFASLPQVDWAEPNLKFVDLTGDGLADLLLTEDGLFTLYPSLGEAGFDRAEQVRPPWDEERGPAVVLADGSEMIFLADMLGDGLSDIVRVRNGEVCYWPNLGYGRFGPKVSMDGAPRFAEEERFDPRRIRLADIDGSGTADLLYVGDDGVMVCFNLSGNAWTAPSRLAVFPTADAIGSVHVIDLFGTGTACLVWSSPLPAETPAPLRYVDLMGGLKPNLLVLVRNNLGAETRLSYAPSTRFYLVDKAAGQPWITRLPFAVYVVERIETLDQVSRNRFVTRYAYHDGFYDGVEREFRGFGMVEQWVTEVIAALTDNGNLSPATNLDYTSFVPPVWTKSWFHTGVYFGRNRVSNYYAGTGDPPGPGEYYREPALVTDPPGAAKLLLDDTRLPDGLTVEEEREACRALHGSLLRQEIYALDGSGQQPHPYTVAEQNFTIVPVQLKEENRYAVFFTHAREALSYHYERNPSDPRVGHALTLEVDSFGNVLKAAAVGYGRRQPDPALDPQDQAKQSAVLITYTEGDVTNAIDEDDAYRTPLSCETRTYELTGLLAATEQNRFTFAAVLTAATTAAVIPYETDPTLGAVQKRLIEQTRTLFRDNGLNGSLSLGVLQSFALPYESYKLAFTPGLVTQVYGGRATDAMLASDGRYMHSQGDANWWIPSGRLFYSPDAAATPAQELANAQQHFFLPCRYRDPFHTDQVSTETIVQYDDYDLLVQETRDALGNRMTVGERNGDSTQPLVLTGQDYRMLQPALVMDPNRNRSAVAFDVLGFVVGTAVMGKPEENLGDTLTGFVTDLTDAVIQDQFANPLANPQAILGQATTRLVYDLFAYSRTKDQANPQPAVVYILGRETHNADLASSQQTKYQHAFSYSDGFGREIQKKLQAEQGPVPQRDPATGRIIVVNGQPQMTPNDVNPRWVGSGWMIFNNKGKPVRIYEPFFTDTQRFEFDVRIGISPVLCYDPVERVVATLHPNHTWEKVVFDPWRQESWDVNDTVLVPDPKNDTDVGSWFRLLPDADYLPTWYAQRQAGALGADEQDAASKAAIHAGTLLVAHFDSLGRGFLTVADNKFKRSNTSPSDPPTEEFYCTRVLLDIEGNQREARDAVAQNGDTQGRVVMRYDHDVLGTRIHQVSMEAGERWTLNDVAGKMIYAWDSRGHQFRTAYDPLSRPTQSYLTDNGAPEVQIGRTVYGESQPSPEGANLRGKVFQSFDQAGVVTNGPYDFKGNLSQSQRQLAKVYKATLDWSASAPLEANIFVSSTLYDALNRPALLTAPDNSGIRPTYNEANLLERLDANLRGQQANGQSVWTPFVTNLNYDAKGQRTSIEYGNGVGTTYEYDPLTFRLVHLQTLRGADVLQDLTYTYDPAGNITRINDAAQQTIYFRNRRIEPSNDYTYDAIYRLIEATGREHLGQTAAQPNPPTPPDAFDAFNTGLSQPGDGNAMGTYQERYFYDAVGNFLSTQHVGSNPANPGWTRTYSYREASQLETGKMSNRLSGTALGATTDIYRYDGLAGLHGNITAMPHLPLMQWDYRDQLQATAQQVVNNGGTPETTWYVYDAGGQRVRKVTEGQADAGQTPTRSQERIYLGGFEIYREYENDGNTPTLERQTLHIMDGQQRIALVETRTQGNDPAPEQLIRYQFGNHLGSIGLELDDQALVLSYEEYFPYGGTAYQAMGSQTETPKRYRYAGKERDEETGFAYFGFRYYAPGLCRWTSADPTSLRDGLNLYRFARANPVTLIDPVGTDSKPSGNVSAETIQDFEYVVERRYKEGGVAPLQLNKNKSVARFIALGEAASTTCSNKVSAEDLFDKGAAIFAAAYGLQREYLDAAQRGERAYDEADRKRLVRYDDYEHPYPMTKEQHENIEEGRDRNKLLLFQVESNLIASCGGPAEGGAEGVEGESSWGARLEPSVKSGDPAPREPVSKAEPSSPAGGGGGPPPSPPTGGGGVPAFATHRWRRRSSGAQRGVGTLASNHTRLVGSLTGKRAAKYSNWRGANRL